MRFFSLRPKFLICAVSSTMLTCQNRSLEARLSGVFQNKGTRTVTQPPPAPTVENSSDRMNGTKRQRRPRTRLFRIVPLREDAAQSCNPNVDPLLHRWTPLPFTSGSAYLSANAKLAPQQHPQLPACTSRQFLLQQGRILQAGKLSTTNSNIPGLRVRDQGVGKDQGCNPSSGA